MKETKTDYLVHFFISTSFVIAALAVATVLKAYQWFLITELNK